jgi:3-phenylpropionate/trans-cinnamate dioxygenase ferredoxin reductase component
MDTERNRPWVIVGGGLAAGRAAATLRKEGFDGRLIVVTSEVHPPYERPALSKDYLRGETAVEKLWAAPPELWSTQETELLTGRHVHSLDPHGRSIELDSGSRLPYARLLLATGSTAVRPEIPGASSDFVHILRTIEDSDRLRAAANSSSTIAVAGGGWIAAEVAASLRQMGRDVALAIPTAEVLERRLGREVGALYSALHERHGVKLVRGVRVVAVVDDRRGRGLELSNGDLLRADLVVLGFGATPNVELARAAGLGVSDGIVVDSQLRTSAPGVFAAGDVASAWHPRYGRQLRVEHWDNAKQQGRTAALNMLGRETPYDRVPYFYSDQYELSMETYGLPEDAGSVAIRRQDDAGRFVALWLQNGRVAAGLHGNDGDSAKAIQRLVRDQLPIELARFEDPRVPLADLLPSELPA